VTALDELIDLPAYSLCRDEKEALLTSQLASLVDHHRRHCQPYARMLELLWPEAVPARLEDVPWLPVGLFKTHELRSVPDEQVVKTLTSSGTTGQTVSRIMLDAQAAVRQSRALAAVMRALLGTKRRPMIIVDARATVADRLSISARAAGILGMSTFGRHHFYALDDDMRLRRDELQAWIAAHAGEQLLIFGFTFMVWQYFLQQLSLGELDLSTAMLVHSGGWKRLEEQAISRPEFKAELQRVTGLARVSNFYGMVEQIGAVYVECSEGRLHAPNFADVLIRDPAHWDLLPDGSSGVVQLLSALPTSYPGHCILTEDVGAVIGRDNCPCGWLGATLELHGRIPKAELRGCSDTHASGLAIAS
jgi:phenylacetate-coenzyme A ligase PaaK-like adenylate-forming protein